jgi:hypothetical protein
MNMIKKFNEFIRESLNPYEEEYANRREETQRRMMMSRHDIENEERLEKKDRQSERVYNCAAGVLELDRADLIRLMGDLRGLIDRAEFEEVVNRLFDNEDLLRSFKSQAEKFSTRPADPFELVEADRMAAKRLIPFAIAQANDLGMDANDVFRGLLGSRDLDESRWDEEGPHPCWGEGFAAGQSQDFSKNPYEEGTEEYDEYEAGFEAGQEAEVAHWKASGKSERRRIAGGGPSAEQVMMHGRKAWDSPDRMDEGYSRPVNNKKRFIKK